MSTGSELFVTTLWTSSWVLIKRGLHDEPFLPPLPFAGLRYFLAFLCLLPFALTSENRARLRALTATDWRTLMLLGIFWYTAAQGAQYGALALLPAATLSLLLNLTFVPVTLLGIVFLGERPIPRQWLGMILAGIGVIVFFTASRGNEVGQGTGIVIAIISMLTNAVGFLLGRSINRSEHLPPVLVTTVSMGIGAVLLLGGGIAVQGVPKMTANGWAIIVWLAVINTSVAFTLWNRSLRLLTAMESSLIGCLMMPQIAVAAVLFLGETLTPLKITGMTLAIMGALLVQYRRS
jgi:drug/metabolite transporter (DMT)-like permease